MKITYIVNRFPKLSETFVLRQITDLIDLGHDVEIIAFGRTGEEEVHEDVTRYGLQEKTHYVEKTPEGMDYELIGGVLQTLLFTDLMHAHFAAAPTGWALNVSKMLGIPYVITAHAYDIFIEPNVEQIRAKFECAEKVLTDSQYARKYLLDLLGSEYADKIAVQYLCIDLEYFKCSEREPKDVTTILFVGRLVEKKGILDAVEAFRHVLERHREVQFRIIGDGPLKKEALAMVEDFNIKEKVLFLGGLSQGRVLQELKGADIFFMPSMTAADGDRESLGVVNIEAQAMGLPVVSTLHTAIPEVVLDGKTGFLVPERDPAALADRLKELIKDPELRARMGKEGRAHVEANFDHKDAAERLDRLFQRLLKDRPLVSETARERREILEARTEGVGALLKAFDEEISQRLGEIKEKDKVIEQLRAHLDGIQNTPAYKAYTGIRKVFKK